MVSFGKAALALSCMSALMGCTSGKETKTVAQRNDNIKGSTRTLKTKQPKSSKQAKSTSDDAQVDTESWRRTSDTWYYDQLAQIPIPVAQQLATFRVVPVGGRDDTPAYIITALAGSDACVEGNPGMGTNGEFTETACAVVDELRAFWVQDPAITEAQLQLVELRAVKGQIYQNTDVIRAFFGSSPLVNDQAIANLQGAIANFLPGNFSNSILASVAQPYGRFSTEGNIGEILINLDQTQEFIRLPAATMMIGDGFFDHSLYVGTLERFNMQKAIVALFGDYVVSVVDPIPPLTAPERGIVSPLEIELEDLELDMYRAILEGYYAGHKKGNLFFDSACEHFQNVPPASTVANLCAQIAGFNMAVMDGDTVNAKGAVDFVKANVFKIAAGEASICPTPPGCIIR